MDRGTGTLYVLQKQYNEAPKSLLEQLLRLSVAAAVGGMACGDDDKPGPERSVFFEGYVYDGATGQRVTTYMVDLTYRDQKIAGTVTEDGHYSIRDYTVNIASDAYRTFHSRNAGVQIRACP